MAQLNEPFSHKNIPFLKGQQLLLKPPAFASASQSWVLPQQDITQLSHQERLLQALQSPVLAPLFLQRYTALPPRPHLLELVDLADEEIPIASSNLCVCDVDHVLGREQREVRTRSALAGRQQALPNGRSNQRGFTPALVQHHTYLTCTSPTATTQFSHGLPSLYLCL